MPARGKFLIANFFELSTGRGAGMAGPAPIPWSEMEAWARLRGRALTPFEARLLRQCDLEMLAAYARKDKTARA